MKLRIEHTYTHVVDATDAEVGWLLDFLTFTTERYVRRGSRAKHVTEKMPLYNSRRKRFPTGLLATVRKRLPETGFTLAIDDQRLAPCGVIEDADLGWLRPYQKTAVMRAAYAERGILWLATGAGKTEIAAGLTRVVPGRWLFAVHRTNLARQAAERIERRTGERCGMLDADTFNVERITCATFQTLTRMLGGEHKRVSRNDAMRLMERWDGIIVDEAHTLPALTYYRTMMSIPNANWRIGLSGTPLARGDKKSIYTVASLGPVIMRVKASELIEAGHLSRPIIRMVTAEQTVVRPTWQGAYTENVVKSRVRNRAVVDMAMRAHKPSMVFVKQLKHGQHLTKLLEKVGHRCVFVNGSAPVEAREAAVERLERRDLDVIVTTAVFQEGVDVPSLRSVVLADGGKSVIALLQKIGRGMRRTHAKTTFEVWDIMDLAEGGKKWLERQSRSRARSYLSEGHSIEIADCADGPWRQLTKSLRVRG